MRVGARATKSCDKFLSSAKEILKNILLITSNVGTKK